MNQFKIPGSVWIFVLPLLCVLQAICFGYTTTMAEADMVRMMAGMVYGGTTGLHLGTGFHYGSQFSFGFYQLLYFLIPTSSLTNPDLVAAAINHFGLVMAFLFALNLCLMLSKLTTDSVALFCSVTFLFCPVTMPFLASGHPMTGACAFLFIACWLFLRAAENGSALRFGVHLILAFAALLVSLTLRAEIAMAFPFVGLCFWTRLSAPWKQRLVPAFLVGVAMLCAVAAFLVLQKPYVAHAGGAVGSLMGFTSQFNAVKRMAGGIGILALGLGSVTGLCLAWELFRWVRRTRTAAATQITPASMAPENRWLAAVTLTLILPSLLFWLTNPQPARHFIIPILGLYMLLGIAGSDKLLSQKKALLLAFTLVMSNQVLAEIVRIPLVAGYKWAYATDGIRRASQQMPLGLYPLDQAANIAAQEILKQEALRMAEKKPADLLIYADSRFYLISQLIAEDPALRMSDVQLGSFDAVLLSRPGRHIYLIDKFTSWPVDVLAGTQNLPDIAGYPIYVQKATISKYDKTEVNPARAFAL